jgi:hypothetical protein
MITLTPRDFEILESLTRRVRLLSTEQLRRIWWPDDVARPTARRRLVLLTEAGFLNRTIINAHPLLPVTRPLFAWTPAAPEPDSFAVAQCARSRWTEAAQPIEVFWATRLAANLFGSTAGRLSGLIHRDHDLLLGQVFVWYRTNRPADARAWLGEDALPKAGYRIKDPDAFLLGPENRPIRVIESAGSYAPAQVQSFHEHCVEHDLPYELW